MSAIVPTRRAMTAALALAFVWPVASGGAAPMHAGGVPATLVGVWHKKLTEAEWAKVGASRAVGIFTAVIKKTGDVTLYKPGDYRPSCKSACFEDFSTTIATNGSRMTVGSVPACSFKGTYRWSTSGRTLTLTPSADKRCPIRETFFGGRWKR